MVVEECHAVARARCGRTANVAQPPGYRRWTMVIEPVDCIAIGGDALRGDGLRGQSRTHGLLGHLPDLGKARWALGHHPLDSLRECSGVTSREQKAIDAVLYQFARASACGDNGWTG